MDRDNRIRFSLVVRAGKKLRNTNVFCVYSSTTRVVRCRAGRGKKVGFTCATWELRTHWTVSLDPCPQGRCYLPRNQPHEGWFGGCCSDPSCPPARTYHSAATGQGHVEGAAHLENSVCRQEGVTGMGSWREGKPAGFLLEQRHYFSCGLEPVSWHCCPGPRVGREGMPEKHEARGGQEGKDGSSAHNRVPIPWRGHVAPWSPQPFRPVRVAAGQSQRRDV